MKMERNQIAIALGFNPLENSAPLVLAQGEGELAQQLIERSQELGLPVVKDEALSQLLIKLPLGREVPENLLKVVAALFALLIKTNDSFKQQWKSKSESNKS